MSKGLRHLRTKRYWALILLGPPLQVIFAYAVFTGLYLGFGLPWPTLEDAGPFASMLEAFGFLGLLVVVEFLVLGNIYRMNFFTRGWSTRKADIGLIELLASSLGIFAGFVIVIGMASAMPDTISVGFENGGFMILLVVLASTFAFIGTVQYGEQTLRNRTEGGTEETGL